jgi:hypothetical protein
MRKQIYRSVTNVNTRYKNKMRKEKANILIAEHKNS